MKINTLAGALRMAAMIEGTSYLLFAVTMPLKYMYDIKRPNMIVGMVHGWVFIAYIILVVLGARKYGWNFKTFALLIIASLLPFATFIADKRVFSKL